MIMIISDIRALQAELEDFVCQEQGSPSFGLKTDIQAFDINGTAIPRFVNEFWTARQRQACSLQEISYRACFKPQLPGFFIHLLTSEGDRVYDPFSGRGTTALEAALNNRLCLANDVNPLSRILTEPRLRPPEQKDLERRLEEIPLDTGARADIDLSMFYHPDTEGELVSLRQYLSEKRNAGLEDPLDQWIRMVGTNRLTGHSKGFFSVYTLPPNQATSPERQVIINKKRGQRPDYRNVRAIILKKNRNLLKRLEPGQRKSLLNTCSEARFFTRDAAETREIEPDSVDLTVTSPPFLDQVQYSADNWLRCWFNGLDAGAISSRVTMSRTVNDWSENMGRVFLELNRVTRPGGWVAFEVGEVKKGKVRLDEHVAPLGLAAGLECAGILVNQQRFTKTSNIWGVDNNSRGTNSNRVVIFRKPG